MLKRILVSLPHLSFSTFAALLLLPPSSIWLWQRVLHDGDDRRLIQTELSKLDAPITKLAETINLANVALKGQMENGHDGLLFQSQFLLRNASAAMNAIKQTAQDANRIARAQEVPTADLTRASVQTVQEAKTELAKLGQTIDELSDSGRALSTFINDTNKQVNGADGTLPILNSQIVKLGAATDALTGDGGLIPTVTKTMGDADAALLAITVPLNRELPATLANFRLSTAHVEKTLGYVENWAMPHKSSVLGLVLGQIASHAAGPAVGAFVSHLFPTSIDVKGTTKVQVSGSQD
jgi:hypothetical protein